VITVFVWLAIKGIPDPVILGLRGMEPPDYITHIGLYFPEILLTVSARGIDTEYTALRHTS